MKTVATLKDHQSAGGESLGLAALDPGFGVCFTPMHRVVEDLRNYFAVRATGNRMSETKGA